MNLACLTAGYYRLLVDSRRSIFNVAQSGAGNALTSHEARGKQNYRAIEWTYSTPYKGGEDRGGGGQRCGQDFSNHHECNYHHGSNHGRCDGETIEPVYISEIHQPHVHTVHMAHRVERCWTPLPPPPPPYHHHHAGTAAVPPPPRPKPQEDTVPRSGAKVSFIFGDPPLDSMNPQNLGYQRLMDECAEVPVSAAYHRLEEDYRLTDAAEDDSEAEGYGYAAKIFAAGEHAEEPLLRDICYAETTDDAEDDDDVSCEEDTAAVAMMMSGDIERRPSLLLSLSGSADDIIDLTSLPPPGGEEAGGEEEEDSDVLLHSLNLAIAAPPPGFRDSSSSDEEEGARGAGARQGAGNDIPVSLIDSVPTQGPAKGPEDPLDEAVVSTLQALEALAASEDQSPVQSESSTGVEISRAFSPESSSDSGNETNSSEMTESSELASAQRHSENHLRMVHIAMAEGYHAMSEEKTEFTIPAAECGAKDVDYNSQEAEAEAKSSAVSSSSSSSQILHSDGGEMEPETMENKSLTDFFSQMHPGSVVMSRPSGRLREGRGPAGGDPCPFSDTSHGVLHREELPHLVGKCHAFTSMNPHYMNQLDLGRSGRDSSNGSSSGRLEPKSQRISPPICCPPSGGARVVNHEGGSTSNSGGIEQHHVKVAAASSAGDHDDYYLSKRTLSLQSEGGGRSLQSSQCSSIDAGCGTGGSGSSSCATPMDSPLCTESMHALSPSSSSSSSSMVRVGVASFVAAEEKMYSGATPTEQGRAGHPPADPALQRKIHAATAGSAEAGFGTLRESSSHRVPKIKETTACTQLKKAWDQDPALSLCVETNTATATTSTTASTATNTKSPPPPPLKSSSTDTGSLRKPQRVVGVLRRSWSTMTPPGTRSFDALLEKTRATFTGKSSSSSSSSCGGAPDGTPPEPPKPQRRSTACKTLPKSWSQKSVDSVNSSGRKLLRGASVLLPTSVAVPRLKTPGAWRRCHAPFSHCFLSSPVNSDGNREDVTVKSLLPPLPCGCQKKQRQSTKTGEEHTASLKADHRAQPPAAAPSVNQEMSLQARLARVRSMMGKTYSLPSGFDGALKDASEMMGLVRWSLRPGGGSGHGSQEAGEAEDEEDGHPGEFSQALQVQARSLSSACSQMAQEHSRPEELLLTLTQSFHTLCCLTQACMSLVEGLSVERQRREVVTQVDEVVMTYVCLLKAAEVASSSSGGDRNDQN
ncbi:LOW QUALITY PROTEIN: hypothetical protein CRUP_028127, partial [Coryphaenoides rupestris]